MSLQQPNSKEFHLVDASNSIKDFSKIYDDYYSRIYNYVRVRILNAHIAEDLTSQIFERVYLKINTYCYEKGSFSAWIYKIAQNIIWDYLRSQKKNTAVSYEETEYDICDVSLKLEDAVCNNETREILSKALALLNERERNIIAFKFWSGMTNREIAELMDLTESNVGVTLFRSIRKLKNILEHMGVDALA